MQGYDILGTILREQKPLARCEARGFVGGGLGASRPQDFYTDLGCCRVKLLLFWALEASLEVLVAHVWKDCMYRHLKVQNRPFTVSDSIF